jgi:hypothetical protein
MDPDANIDDQRRLGRRLREARARARTATEPRTRDALQAEIARDASRLADLIEALRAWVTAGGARPRAAASRALYTTAFCNRAHRLRDGKPVGHECYVLDPAKLRLESEHGAGAVEGSIVREPRTLHRGVREVML